jgi:hypothetical protein
MCGYADVRMTDMIERLIDDWQNWGIVTVVPK